MTIKGKISIKDVRAVLAGDDEHEAVDPFATNAQKIRDLLGRGSLATIQRHLNTIRDEIRLATTKAADPDGLGIPTPPADVVSTIWNAAWQTAHTTLLERCAELNNDRDMLRKELEVSTGDTEALAFEISKLETEIAGKSEIIEAMKNEAIELASAHAVEIETLAARLDEAHANNQRMEALIREVLGKKEATLGATTVSATPCR